MTQLWLRGDPIGSVKGVLFDKDGTLSNSEAHLIKLGKQRVKKAINLFKNSGYSTNQVSKLSALLASTYGLSSKGVRADGILAIAARQENLLATASIFCSFGECWPNALNLAEEVFSTSDSFDRKNQISNSDNRNLLPGALEVLKELKKTASVCALISNDSQEGIQSFLERNYLKDLIANYWSAEDNPKKPSPDAVKGLCHKIGLSPYQCALIGDADTDLDMARQAGIGLSIGYTAGWANPPELTKHQYLIHHWNDLSVKATP